MESVLELVQQIPEEDEDDNREGYRKVVEYLGRFL